MFRWLFGKLEKRAQVRQSDRSERNAVIRRIVTAAAITTQKREAVSNEGASQVVGPLTANAVSATDSGGIPRDKVAERAYQIWMNNGCPTGTVERDWEQALREVAAELEPKPAPTP